MVDWLDKFVLYALWLARILNRHINPSIVSCAHTHKHTHTQWIKINLLIMQFETTESEMTRKKIRKKREENENIVTSNCNHASYWENSKKGDGEDAEFYSRKDYPNNLRRVYVYLGTKQRWEREVQFKIKQPLYSRRFCCCCCCCWNVYLLSSRAQYITSKFTNSPHTHWVSI